MAKIHKVELFLVDCNDDFDTVEDYLEYVNNDKYALSAHIAKSESKDFEWDDDVPVNRIDCTTDEYNEFFQKL